MVISDAGEHVGLHLPRHLLYRMIACRLQAERLGDLDRDTQRFLDRVAAASPPQRLRRKGRSGRLDLMELAPHVGPAGGELKAVGAQAFEARIGGPVTLKRWTWRCGLRTRRELRAHQDKPGILCEALLRRGLDRLLAIGLVLTEDQGLQAVEVEIDDRRGVKGENLAQRKASDHGIAERLAQF
jgi:hypothetical protein